MGRRAPLIAAVVFLATVAAVPAQPAFAVASAGVSQRCDDYGHCVTGSAFSSNAGVSLDASGVGAAVAACKGGSNGAVLMQITCSVGGDSETMSFPGSAGVVPLVTDTGTSERIRVCWSIVGYFPNVAGEPFEVPTQGCALLSA
jgi:hypothetical protein